MRFKTPEAAKRQILFYNNKNDFPCMPIVFNRSNNLGGGLDCLSPYVGSELKDEHVKPWMAWAGNKQLLLDSQKQRVLFYESRFNINFNNGIIKILRQKGAQFYRKWLNEFDRYGGGSVMMWAGITASDRTELVSYESNVNAGVYVYAGA